MIKYENQSDEELIVSLRDGDEKVIDFLLEKYKNLVRKKAGSMFILGADREDLIQEGMIGLYKAIRDYDSGRDASLYTFADLCVSRQMYKAVEAGNRKKHAPLNTYISIYADSFKEDENADYAKSDSLLEILSSLTKMGPEEEFIDREQTESLEREIFEALSDFECKVLNLKITGMDYTEIARVLGRDEKSTDNALSRIKSKVKKILEKNGEPGQVK